MGRLDYRSRGTRGQFRRRERGVKLAGLWLVVGAWRTAAVRVHLFTGTNLGSATAVKFGANAATITSNTATQIIATNPAGSAGTVDITVTTPGGPSPLTANDRLVFAGVPTVTGVSPAAGPAAGGQTLLGGTIYGVSPWNGKHELKRTADPRGLRAVASSHASSCPSCSMAALTAE